MTVSSSPCFRLAIELFDAANAADPNMETVDGVAQPKELVYGRRMSEMLARYAPEASEAVQLAVRAQHICRWQVPRDSQPMDRDGYLRWRSGLYTFQAEFAGKLMREAGCAEDLVQRVMAAVAKKGIKVNPEAQMLEDVADLVFIEHYMLAFAGKKQGYSEAKWLDIIRKTWKKMSERARKFALSGSVRLPEPLVPLIVKAIDGA
jgi:hypothetical protein